MIEPGLLSAAAGGALDGGGALEKAGGALEKGGGTLEKGADGGGMTEPGLLSVAAAWGGKLDGGSLMPGKLPPG